MSRKDQIQNKVEAMKGKSFLYGTNVLQVVNYDIDDQRERVYLFTTRKAEPYDRPFDSALAFLSEFEAVNNTTLPATSSPTELAPVREGYQMLGSASLAKQLGDILMDNITKIREDKAFIPQATAIRDNVDSMINLAKTEIAYLAVAKKRNLNSEDDF